MRALPDIIRKVEQRQEYDSG